MRLLFQRVCAPDQECSIPDRDRPEVGSWRAPTAGRKAVLQVHTLPIAVTFGSRDAQISLLADLRSSRLKINVTRFSL